MNFPFKKNSYYKFFALILLCVVNFKQVKTSPKESILFDLFIFMNNADCTLNNIVISNFRYSLLLKNFWTSWKQKNLQKFISSINCNSYNAE